MTHLVTRHRAAAVVMAASTVLAAVGPASGVTPAPGPTVAPRTAAATSLPLHGVTIALDPGHQLGNHHFPAKLRVQVPAGGFTKDCNTVGASTDSGVPEATVNWRIAALTKTRLEALGATVRLTRTSNREDRWGPCVDQRARFAGDVGARVLVSIHADGARARDHGFHVIVPVRRSPWTTRTAAPSLTLATRLRAALGRHGFARSSYIGGGSALSVRSDLATLNLSRVPVAMIEVGNMRNRADAYAMTHARGQRRYADSIVTGLRGFLDR